MLPIRTLPEFNIIPYSVQAQEAQNDTSQVTLKRYHFDQEKNFQALLLGNVIDKEGKADDALIPYQLPELLESSKEKIKAIGDLPISPNPKDLKHLPEHKIHAIIEAFQYLKAKYRNGCPFYWNIEANTMGLRANFSIKNLISFMRGKVPFVDDLKIFGGGVPCALGKEYIAHAINRVMKEDHRISEIDMPQSITTVEDYDFFCKCTSLEKIEETLIKFFLNRILYLEEDTECISFLIRELVFKNLFTPQADEKNLKTFVGFSNSIGPDIDITFSLNNLDPPFTYANGLTLNLPLDFKIQGDVRPYAACGINPYQCLSDKFAGILNGPAQEVSYIERRLPWIIASLTKGGRLYSSVWEQHITKYKKNGEITKLSRHDVKLSEKLFVRMVEAINVFLLMQKNGCVKESLVYFEAVRKDLELFKDILETETEPACKIISSLFLKFSCPLKGMYYLYITSLYAIGLETASSFSIGYALNRSTETLALQMSFKDIHRTINFFDAFDETYPLNSEELIVVAKWLPYFIKKDSSLPIKHKNIQTNNSFLDVLSAYEKEPNVENNAQIGVINACADDLNYWMRWKNHQNIATSASINKFLTFFAHLKEADVKDKNTYFTLFKVFQTLFDKNTIFMPEYFVNECFKFANWIKDEINRNQFKTSILKIFNKAVCQPGETAKIAQYFLHRADFKTIDLNFENEDALAFSLLNVETGVINLTKTLEIGIHLFSKKLFKKGSINKAYALLEIAATNDLEHQAYELSKFLKIEKNFTSTRCYSVLTSCMNSLNCDDTFFWLNSLLDCLKVEKIPPLKMNKKTLHKLTLNLSKENLNRLFAHTDVHNLFSKEDMQLAFENHLLALFENIDPTHLDLNVLNTYEELFTKLNRGSLNERKITTQAIAFCCKAISEHENSLLFDNNLKNLCESVFKTLQFDELKGMGLQILLWAPDAPYFDKGNTKKQSIWIKKQFKPWQDRLFEIARESIDSLLSIQSTNVKVNDAILMRAANLLFFLAKDNSRAAGLMEQFEKLLFAKQSTHNMFLFEKNLASCKGIYQTLSEKKYFAKHPQIFYKATLMIERKDSPFEQEIKIASFNQIYDFCIESKQFFMTHFIMMILSSNTMEIFGKDNSQRKSLIFKIIDAAFLYPNARGFLGIPIIETLVNCILGNDKQLITYDSKDAAKEGSQILFHLSDALLSFALKEEKGSDVSSCVFVSTLFNVWSRGFRYSIFESEKQFIDTLELCFQTNLLQKIFLIGKHRESLLKFYGSLLLAPLSDEETILCRVDLFHRFITELLMNDDKAVNLQGKALLQEGMKAGIYKSTPGKIGKDTEFLKLLNCKS